MQARGSNGQTVPAEPPAAEPQDPAKAQPRRQGEGLNIGGVRGRAQAPWFVVGKDVANNILYVDQDSNSPWMLSRRLRSETMHWIGGSAPARVFRCSAQTRYRQPDEDCEVTVLDDGTLLVRFDRPQRAVTPGQSLVLYDGAVCLGGAVIAATDAPMERRLAGTSLDEI